MAGAVEIKTASPNVTRRNFDPTAVVPEPLPPVVTATNGEDAGVEKESREIVLGKNVHTTCFAVTEPEANDEFTGDKEAYMAGVLARYRKSLVERTKHHLGKEINVCWEIIYIHLAHKEKGNLYIVPWILVKFMMVRVNSKTECVIWCWICFLKNLWIQRP